MKSELLKKLLRFKTVLNKLRRKHPNITKDPLFSTSFQLSPPASLNLQPKHIFFAGYYTIIAR
jgi:hypothetical protein